MTSFGHIEPGKMPFVNFPLIARLWSIRRWEYACQVQRPCFDSLLVLVLPLQTAQRAAEAIALSEQLLAGLEYRLTAGL